jgi:hypothetical protein
MGEVGVRLKEVEVWLDACKYCICFPVPTVAQIHRVDIARCLLRSSSSCRHSARGMDRIRVCSFPFVRLQNLVNFRDQVLKISTSPLSLLPPPSLSNRPHTRDGEQGNAGRGVGNPSGIPGGQSGVGGGQGLWGRKSMGWPGTDARACGAARGAWKV